MTSNMLSVAVRPDPSAPECRAAPAAERREAPVDRETAAPAGVAATSERRGANEQRDGAGRAPARKAKRGGGLRLLMMIGGVALVALGSATLWLRGGRYVSTDNAYVRAAKLMVSTDVSGIVSSVDVKEGQTVQAGDILFRVDPTQFQIAVDAARAQLASVRMNIESAKQDYQRIDSEIAAQSARVSLAEATFDRSNALAKKEYASLASYDQSRFALTAAQKTLESLTRQAKVVLAKLGGDPDLPVERHPRFLAAKTQVDEMQRQLDHTIVRAPFSGIVTQVDALQPGAFLVSQTAALTNTGALGLVSTDKVWIDANLKETDLTLIKTGDPVEVRVDAYPGRVWTARVENIDPATGSEFSILPAQNASGNWVKVVQRIAVRIAVDRTPDDPVLRPGMSASVEIDTGVSRTLSDLWSAPAYRKAPPRGFANADGR